MSTSTPLGRFLGATALGAALALLPAAASLAAGATVLSAAGGAQAGGAPLGCGGAVGAGQSVDTGAGGQAGLSVGGSYVQLGADTTLSFGPDGTLELRRGTVRAVDLGQGGAIAIHTPQGTARSTGGDVQVQVAGGPMRVCALKGAVTIEPEGASAPGSRVEPGTCATVGAGGQLAGVGPAGEGLALAGAAGCVDVALADQFSPTDVAAPPPSLDMFPFDPDKRTYSPCDSPGSGCNVINLAPPPPSPPPAPPGFGFGTGPADPTGGFQTGPADPSLPGPQ